MLPSPDVDDVPDREPLEKAGSGREKNIPGSPTIENPAPRMSPPEIPASSEDAQQLAKKTQLLSKGPPGSRTSAQIRPALAILGRSLAALGQSWRDLMKLGRRLGDVLAYVGQLWPKRGQLFVNSGPEFVGIGPSMGRTIAVSGHMWPSLVKFCQIWPRLADLGRMLAKSGRALVKINQSWPTFG